MNNQDEGSVLTEKVLIDALKLTLNLSKLRRNVRLCAICQSFNPLYDRYDRNDQILCAYCYIINKKQD